MVRAPALLRPARSVSCRREALLRWTPRGVQSFSSSPPDESYFAVLGVPAAFSTDRDELKRSYRRLMAQLHPDKHSDKLGPEKLAMERRASEVTRAYDALKEPRTRATHLLRVLGRPMRETATGELVGHEFLMRVMEIREQVEARSGTDLRHLLQQNQAQIQAACEELDLAFRERNLDKALEVTAKLHYWDRIRETIREKMDDH